jgi:hypothetical protein
MEDPGALFRVYEREEGEELNLSIVLHSRHIMRRGNFMKFEVVYEIPPMRGIFRTEINADSIKDAEEKIRLNPETANFRIKEVKEISQ